MELDLTLTQVNISHAENFTMIQFFTAISNATNNFILTVKIK